MSSTKGDKAAAKYNQDSTANNETENNQTRPTTAA